MRKIKAFSLIELLIALILVSAFFIMGTSSIFYFIRRGKSEELRADVRSGLSQLTAHILRIGRLAGSPPVAGAPQGCVVESAPTAIRCKIDFEVPAVGTLTEVRFRHDTAASQVIYEQLTGLAWTTKSTYSDVALFEVCGDAAGCTICSDGNACGTTPDRINTLYQAYIGSGPAPELLNRFIRFRLRGVVKNLAAGVDVNQSEFQSAFFVRNPPRAGDPNLTYLWVGKHF